MRRNSTAALKALALLTVGYVGLVRYQAIAQADSPVQLLQRQAETSTTNIDASVFTKLYEDEPTQSAAFDTADYFTVSSGATLVPSSRLSDTDPVYVEVSYLVLARDGGVSTAMAWVALSEFSEAQQCRLLNGGMRP